jgi:hypothetical protein
MRVDFCEAEVGATDFNCMAEGEFGLGEGFVHSLPARFVVGV